MRKAKKYIIIAAALLILTFISGCSQKGEEKPQENVHKDTSDTKEIVVTTMPQETPAAEESSEEKTEPASIPKNPALLKYLGHSSIRITTQEGKVIYVDPYAGEDYLEPADVILVTHGHSDHNQIDKIKNKKEGVRIITHKEALKEGKYQSLELDGIKIKSVPAYNKNHPKDKCVGYVIEFDGIVLYHAGDTSKISEMENLTGMNITYALLPMDGVYNMGPEEASECAKIINAKYNIPIHTGPNGVYSQENIDKFSTDNKIVMKPGDTIELKTN